MKKVYIAGIAALVALAANAELKIGTVDMMLLVRNHSSYEQNKNLLLSTEKDYQKRLDGMKSDLESIQDEGKKLADELRNPMLAESAKAKLEKDIIAVQNRFMAQQQKMRQEMMRNQQDLGDLEARLLKAQAEDIKKRISAFATKNGYDAVLDDSAALYAKESLDVTDEILKDMGVDPKKAKGRDDDESK